MRWTPANLVVLSVAALVVASCGGDDSDEATAVTTAAPAATAATAAATTEATPATTAAPAATTIPATTAAPEPTAAPVTTAAPATTAVEAVPTLQEGVLTVGRVLEVTPLAATDASGNVVGFEPDLVDEMATRLGLTVAWIDTDFDALLAELDAGRFDMAASNVTLTPERAELLGFTDPYFWDPEAAAFNEDLANVAFPIDPANPELEAALSAALQSMLSDGTYQSLYDAWFDTPESSVLFDRT